MLILNFNQVKKKLTKSKDKFRTICDLLWKLTISNANANDNLVNTSILSKKKYILVFSNYLECIQSKPCRFS